MKALILDDTVRYGDILSVRSTVGALALTLFLFCSACNKTEPAPPPPPPSVEVAEVGRTRIVRAAGELHTRGLREADERGARDAVAVVEEEAGREGHVIVVTLSFYPKKWIVQRRVDKKKHI